MPTRLAVATIAFVLGGVAIATTPQRDKIRADVIVATQAIGKFEEGDAIHVFTEEHNLNVNAQNLVNPRDMPRHKGRIVASTTLEAYLEETKEYRFNRISRNWVRRTNLITGEVDTIGIEPNEDGDAMDVPLFVARRLAHENNMMFGDAGREYWYGGGQRITEETMDTVWDMLEARGVGVRSVDFPFTQREKEKFLVLKVEEKEEDLAALLEPDVWVDEEGNATTTRARMRKIDLAPFANDIAKKNRDARASVRTINIQEK